MNKRDEEYKLDRSDSELREILDKYVREAKKFSDKFVNAREFSYEEWNRTVTI